MTDDVETEAAPSAEERVLAHLSGLPTEAVTEQVTEPDIFELAFEGETFHVPSKLKDAFMRTQDYTQKTQELGESRRAVDQVRGVLETRQLDAQFAQSVAAESQELSVIDAYLAQVTKTDIASMNAESLMRHKFEVDNVKERKVALQAAIDGKRTAFQNDYKAKLDDLRGKSKEAASKAIPDFSEDTYKAVRSFAQTEGLTEQEIDNVLLDARSIKVLWKAMQFDKVQAGTKQVQGKVDKVLRPQGSSNPMPQEVRAKLDYNRALNKASTSAQKATVIEGRLAGMFGGRH